jgi:hypothetical protein
MPEPLAQSDLEPAPWEAGKGVGDRGNPLFDGKRTNPNGTLTSLLKGNYRTGRRLTSTMKIRVKPAADRQTTNTAHAPCIIFGAHSLVESPLPPTVFLRRDRLFRSYPFYREKLKLMYHK